MIELRGPYLMYGVALETRPSYLESDAFLYNLDDPKSRSTITETNKNVILL